MTLELIIYSVLFVFFLMWKFSYDLFYKFVDWFRKGTFIDFLREHGLNIVVFCFGLRLAYLWTMEVQDFYAFILNWRQHIAVGKFPEITWDMTTALQYIPPSDSRVWNILTICGWFINWLYMRTIGITFHAQQPGSNFTIAPMPSTQVRVKTITRAGEAAYGVGVAFKWKSRIFIATAKHVLNDAMFIQVGRDGFWMDLEQNYRCVHSDGVVWEVDAGVTSKLGVKLASVGQITGQTAVSTVSTDMKQSSGIVYLLDKVVVYSGSTEVGFSGAPYLAGSRVYGVHIGEASGRNIGFDLYDAMTRYDAPETLESRVDSFGTENIDVRKDYYKTSGRNNNTSMPRKKPKSELENYIPTPRLDLQPGTWTTALEGWESKIVNLESKVDNVVSLIQSTLSQQDKSIPIEQTTGSTQRTGMDFQQGPQSTAVTPHARRAPMNGLINSPNSSVPAKPKNSLRSQLSKRQKKRLRETLKKRGSVKSTKPLASTAAHLLEQQPKRNP